MTDKQQSKQYTDALDKLPEFFDEKHEKKDEAGAVGGEQQGDSIGESTKTFNINDHYTTEGTAALHIAGECLQYPSSTAIVKSVIQIDKLLLRSPQTSPLTEIKMLQIVRDSLLNSYKELNEISDGATGNITHEPESVVKSTPTGTRPKTGPNYRQRPDEFSHLGQDDYTAFPHRQAMQYSQQPPTPKQLRFSNLPTRKTQRSASPAPFLPTTPLVKIDKFQDEYEQQKIQSNDRTYKEKFEEKFKITRSDRPSCRESTDRDKDRNVFVNREPIQQYKKGYEYEPTEEFVFNRTHDEPTRSALKNPTSLKNETNLNLSRDSENFNMYREATVDYRNKHVRNAVTTSTPKINEKRYDRQEGNFISNRPRDQRNYKIYDGYDSDEEDERSDNDCPERDFDGDWAPDNRQHIEYPLQRTGIYHNNIDRNRAHSGQINYAPNSIGSYHGAEQESGYNLNFRTRHRSPRDDSSWTFSLHQALRMIPIFDGNPDTLPLFCSAIMDVLTEFGPKAQKWVMNTMPSRLKGRAAKGYTARLTQYRNVESLLEDLKIQCTGGEGADDVMLRMKVIRQEVGESAGDYGLRVQELHNRILNIYDADNSLRDFEKHTYKNKADMEALEQFLFGLSGPLEHQVRSKYPLTLRDAINIAVTFENRSSARRPCTFPRRIEDGTIRITKADYANSFFDTPGCPNHNEVPIETNVVCEFCGVQGHRFSRCFSLEKELKNGNISKITGKNTASYCIYCKQAGHIAQDCTSRTILNERQELVCVFCGNSGHRHGDCALLELCLSDESLAQRKRAILGSSPVIPPIDAIRQRGSNNASSNQNRQNIFERRDNSNYNQMRRRNNNYNNNSNRNYNNDNNNNKPRYSNNYDNNSMPWYNKNNNYGPRHNNNNGNNYVGGNNGNFNNNYHNGGSFHNNRNSMNDRGGYRGNRGNVRGNYQSNNNRNFNNNARDGSDMRWQDEPRPNNHQPQSNDNREQSNTNESPNRNGPLNSQDARCQN